jgi:hypothetical protein
MALFMLFIASFEYDCKVEFFFNPVGNILTHDILLLVGETLFESFHDDLIKKWDRIYFMNYFVFGLLSKKNLVYVFCKI